MSRWLLLQLADSGFPSGGFVHSGGLEAAVQLGELDDAGLLGFVRAALWQAGTFALPLVAAGHAADRAGLVALDARAHACLLGHVGNRASRSQGRALAATAARSFADLPALVGLDAAIRTGALHGHLAPLFGAVTAALGVAAGAAAELHLHLTLRGVLSAAVRLGRLGPHEAQAVQRELAGECDAVLAAAAALTPDDVASSAPGWEVVGALHDTLYARLFQS